MKLFQKLTKVLKKFKLKLIEFLLNGKEVNLTTDDIIIESDNLSVNKDGSVEIRDEGKYSTSNLKVSSDNSSSSIYSNGIIIANTNRENIQCTVTEIMFDNMSASKSAVYGINYMNIANSNNSTDIDADGITTPVLTQTSLENQKKNFEKFKNGLEIIKQVDIYKYNLKSEKDTDKKHIGFVIGDNYKYSKELTSKDNNGADIYSLASCCLQAIREQQEIIENLEKRIKELEEQ